MALGLRVENYLASLLDSALPLPPWTVALVLVALLLANYYVVRSVRLANEAQHFVAVEDWTPFRRVSQPKYQRQHPWLLAWLLGIWRCLAGLCFSPQAQSAPGGGREMCACSPNLCSIRTFSPAAIPRRPLGAG
jgi:hypothetical protein